MNIMNNITKSLLFFGIMLFFVFPLYPEEDRIEDIVSEDSEIEDTETEQPDRDIPTWDGEWDQKYGLYGNFGHSSLGLENENFTAGLDFYIFRIPFGGMMGSIHTLGVGYQYHNIENNLQSIMRMQYTYFRYLLSFGVGTGLSCFYNVSNNNIGITPQIGGGLLFGLVILNCNYRYNIVLNNLNNSYHEIILSVSIGKYFGY